MRQICTVDNGSEAALGQFGAGCLVKANPPIKVGTEDPDVLP